MHKKQKIYLSTTIAIILVVAVIIAIALSYGPSKVNNSTEKNAQANNSSTVTNAPTDAAAAVNNPTATASGKVNNVTKSPANTASSTPIKVASSDKTINFIVSSTSGKAGQTVKVSVDISKDSTMSAAKIELSYDNKLLDLVTAVKGTALSLGICAFHDEKSEIIGKKTLEYINLDPMNKAGSIMELSFKIKAGVVPQKTLLNLSVLELTNNTYKNLPYEITPGAISVVS